MFNPKSTQLIEQQAINKTCDWKPEAGFKQKLISTSSNSSTTSTKSLNGDLNSMSGKKIRCSIKSNQDHF